MDVSNITNISGFAEMASFTNNAVDGILFSGGLIVFFIIILMVSIRNGEPFENVLAASSWVMFVCSMFFWFAHLVPTSLPIAFLIVSAASTLILYASRR